jgi:hypothetical protein
MRLAHVTFGYDETELFEQTQRIFAPLLARHHLRLVSAERDSYRRTVPRAVYVEIGFHSRGRIVADLVGVGLDALALLDAVDNGNLGREQVAHLLRGHHAAARRRPPRLPGLGQEETFGPVR